MIEPINMNMGISRTVLEGKWDNYFLDLVQKVAIYTIIPFSMIVAFEAIVKNCLLINTLNVSILLINQGYSLYERMFNT